MNTNPYQAPRHPPVKKTSTHNFKPSINGAAVACAFLLFWAGLVYLTFSGVH